MKILPLALVLIATPALAQVSTPVLRKGSERPKAWTPSATPAPSPRQASSRTQAPSVQTTAPAPAKASATGRSGRTVARTKQDPKKAEAEATPGATASEPKKGGGFFGFFGKLFGGGKKKAADPGAPARTAATAEVPSGAVRKPAAPVKPGVVADPGSSIRPNLKDAKKGATSSIVPSMASGREKSTDRSAIIPATVQNAKPDAANTSLIRPPLKKPASESAGPSSIKPTLKPASPSDTPEPSSIIPPVSPKSAPKSASVLPGATTETATEFDKARYGKVKREAAADPAIVQLGEKLNSTPPGPAYKKAARSYANSLFAKMREIDPSQQEWINRMESATIRRIDAGKAFVAE